LQTWLAGKFFAQIHSIFSVILSFTSAGAGWAGTKRVSFCSANVGEQKWTLFFFWDAPSQMLFAINREKRRFDQERFPGLGVNGSCKVELNFRSEKLDERNDP
jgi:hypothetical protein